MKKSYLKIAVIALLSVFMASCLTVEKKQYSFTVKKDGSGSGTIKFINIVSQDDEDKDVSFEDFGELMNDYYEGEQFETDHPNMTVTDKKLYEENDVLCAEVSFTFTHIDSIGFMKFEDCSCAPLLYYLGSLSETFNSTNGTYLGENTNMPFIKWGGKETKLNFETIVQENLSDCRSLLDLYNVWLESH